MAQDVGIEYLVVSRFADPPGEDTLTRSLVAGNVRVVSYTPSSPTAGAAASTSQTGRTRLGSYVLEAPAGASRAVLSVLRYDAPVLTGMGERAFTLLTRSLYPDDVQTLRDGTLALRLRVDMTDAAAQVVLDWCVRVLRAVLDLTHGAVFDPAAQRCFGGGEVSALASNAPLGHLSFHDEVWDAESRWLHTHGLQKFGRPELDLVGVPHSLLSEGWTFLREVSENLARGATLVAGQEIALEDLGKAVATGVSPDLDHQAPFGRLRLADTDTSAGTTDQRIAGLLKRMALSEAGRGIASGDTDAALDALDRVLAADPDDCAAMTMKAQVLLREGQAMEALELGELMQVRSPGDYRGPYILGAALHALGRDREAAQELTRAIDREPEAVEAFALRAEVYTRLGSEQLAAVDRAHAAYLGR